MRKAVDQVLETGKPTWVISHYPFRPLGHASDDVIDATCDAYGISRVSGTRPACDACTMANMPRAPTSHETRSAPSPAAASASSAPPPSAFGWPPSSSSCSPKSP